jgi:RNA polymerase sigma factor (sigma-70 family)
MDDDIAALLAAATDGDQAAWDAIVERYSNLLWSVARSYRLGDADAADVLQTVWLRLLENLNRISDPTRLAAWLATVARNEIHRLHRKGSRITLTAEEPTLDAALTAAAGPVRPPDAVAITGERDRQLWVAFAELSRRCQEVLRTVVTGTVAAEPLAYREASRALGMPIGGIGPTRMRCLASLREILQRSGISGEPEVS